MPADPDALDDAPVDAPGCFGGAFAETGLSDPDGDGVPSASDNCPTVSNPLQHNEDGDSFGDACDKCPPIADDRQPDADCDGVSDACDPRPATPGDSITVFDGFNTALEPEWILKTSQGSPASVFRVADGVLTVDASRWSATLHRPGPSTGHDAIYTSITDSAHSATAVSAIGLLHAVRPDVQPDAGMLCYLTNAYAGTVFGVLGLSTRNPTGAPNWSNLTPFMADRSWVLADRRKAGWHGPTDRFWCLADDEAHTLTYEFDPQPWNSSIEPYKSGSAAFYPAIPPCTHVGLRVENATASFAWFMVIQND